jgi:hypothetical protein
MQVTRYRSETRPISKTKAFQACKSHREACRGSIELKRKKSTSDRQRLTRRVSNDPTRISFQRLPITAGAKEVLCIRVLGGTKPSLRTCRRCYCRDCQRRKPYRKRKEEISPEGCRCSYAESNQAAKTVQQSHLTITQS